MSKNLRNLTPGERWWLWRRRQGLSQEGAARRLRVPRGVYKLVELGRLERRPAPQVSHTQVRERLRLARRRERLELREFCRAFGVCHVTVLKLERAGDANVVRFWKARGYKF